MWLLTPRGFYSVVAHRGRPDHLLVRARARGDLELLDDLLPDIQIEHTPDRDYSWRTVVLRYDWAAAVGRLAQEIDYPNFKNRVAEVQGYERASLYGKVWSILLRLQLAPR